MADPPEDAIQSCLPGPTRLVILRSSTQANSNQDAVDLLNTLQTPFGVLRKRRDAGIKLDKTANDEMRKCLGQIGYSVTSLFLLMLAASNLPLSNETWTNSISFTWPGLKAKAPHALSWTQSCPSTASHMIHLEKSVSSPPLISLRFENGSGSTQSLYLETCLPNISLKYGKNLKRPLQNQRSLL